MWLAYDLEACFLKKGQTRAATKILEIALYNKDISYQRLVNPLSRFANGRDVLDNLKELNQHPENTVNFWARLLVQKKALPTALARKRIADKADAIATLLTRSACARTYEDEKGMMLALARHGDDEEKAATDLRTGEGGFSDVFYTAKEAIDGALKAGKDHIWVAHNGKSFDEKILRGHGVDSVRFADSLPLIKHAKPGLESYSQPKVYKHLFNKPYFAHHALEDSIALFKILNEVVDDLPALLKTKHRDTDLHTLKYIGPKTVEKLYKKNIKTKAALLDIVRDASFDEWCADFSFVHNHKAFYRHVRQLQHV